ncbi:H-2 class II histocompatibility antigen, E-S beta chain-like [Gracilinanus agilis]|uniref:H-2 class II histocompatibility antigen, E-S beta chain-like n=1 Tax=Gracilinanus agilis TaxID=191870 RepID=UPI001CFDF1DC|nr:H-2 class II histocompatibility antigen, E-S beta chain-like [Gracilinanus agilis]
MVCMELLGGPSMTVLLMMLNTLTAWGRDIPENYLHQVRSECHMTNGTQRVHFVGRLIYDREEFVRFDSDVGLFEARMELWKSQVQKWNSQKEIVERAQSIVNVCRHNYKLYNKTIVHRKVQPRVKVFPVKTQPLGHHNLLLCSVTSFYPGEIKVSWFKNAKEEKSGVLSTGLIRNGDWTFQTLVMLEMTPQRGDVFTCCVDHVSLQSPVFVDWRAQSESAQTKMLTGVGGLVFGLILLGAGLVIRHRSSKDSYSGTKEDSCLKGVINTDPQQQDFPRAVSQS